MDAFLKEKLEAFRSLQVGGLRKRWLKLNVLSAIYWSGGDTLSMIQNLITLLMLGGSADGSFGSQTLAAVKKYQSSFGFRFQVCFALLHQGNRVVVALPSLLLFL